MAAASGPKALRGRDRLRSDAEHEAVLRDHAEAIGLSVVGYYHSHPGGRRDLSREDLTAASTRRRELAVPAFLELVVVPTHAGEWAWAPWVIRPGLGADVAKSTVV